MLPKISSFSSYIQKMFRALWMHYELSKTVIMRSGSQWVAVDGCEAAVGQWWSDAAEYISESVHGGSHLARHHCSGEQLVQLNQLVGCGVKLERNAVQRVPRFHLDHKTRERTEKSRCCSGSGHFFIAVHVRHEGINGLSYSTTCFLYISHSPVHIRTHWYMEHNTWWQTDKEYLKRRAVKWFL